MASAGTSSSARARMPALMVESTLTGRCGPCCSTAATGKTAMASSGQRVGKIGPGEVLPVIWIRSCLSVPLLIRNSAIARFCVSLPRPMAALY